MMSMGNRSADQGTAADGSLPRKRRRNRRRSSGGSTSSNSSSSSCSSTANGHEGKLVVAKSVLSTWVSSAVLIICGLLPFGYIHPDEYFQNPEVVAGDVLGVDVFRPWEYESREPCRSIVFPAITTGMPFLVLRNLSRLGVPDVLSGTALFVAPRLVFIGVAYAIDYILRQLCKELRINPAGPMMALRTSYVTLVFHARPFSNSIESLLFALGLLLVLCGGTRAQDRPVSHYWKRLVALGVLMAAGVFNRPTFLVFSLALGVGATIRLCCQGKWHPLHAISALSRSVAICRLLAMCGYVSVGFFPTALVFSILDSLYFGTLQLAGWSVKGTLTLTPLNNLLYNTQTSNLAQHGLHFKGTHILVNAPLLFGPLFLAALLPVCHQIYSRLGSTSLAAAKVAGPVSAYLLACCATVLVALSLFPHQEPRFLCPLLVPLCLIAGNTVFASSTLRKSWAVMNIALFLLFGLAHQGGVTRSLIYLENRLGRAITNEQVHIIYANTYMPPRHLLRIPRAPDGLCRNITVHDLGSADVSSIEHLVELLSKTKKVRCTSPEAEQRIRLFVVTPATIGLSLNLFRSTARFWPHFSSEAPPYSFQPKLLSLVVLERLLSALPVSGGMCLAPVASCLGTR